MKISLVALLVGFGFTLGFPADAETISPGQKIPVLKTAAGEDFQDVTVKEVLPTGLKIMYSGGFKTFRANELPQYQESFDKARAEAPKEAAPVPAAPAEPEWLPSSDQEVAACALFVHVSKGIGSNGGFVEKKGSAFLCNLGKTTYIYSNAHVFDGAIDFDIRDKKGTVYNDFVSVEIASSGQAFWKETGFGGDVVRIRLKEYRPQALSIDPHPVTEENAKGRKILITGDTGGLGTITELKGVVTGMAPDSIIKHNAPTLEGNSGSPIVDLATYKVIGILTWGKKLSAPLEEIWSKEPVESREGINGGATLAKVVFEPSSFEKLRQQRAAMNDLKKNIRLLGLLDTVMPAKQGVFVNTHMVVMGEYTVADLLAESPNHPVVKELLRLDKVLRSKSSGNISISSMEMMGLYQNSLQTCLGYIASERLGIETTQSATFFMKCQLKRSRVLEICKAYESLCERSVEWFAAQQGTRGKAVSLDSKLRLPPLASGLKGLGLKENQ
jgi:hypothetical protein